MIARIRLRNGYFKAKKRVWWAKPTGMIYGGLNDFIQDQDNYQLQIRMHRKLTKQCSKPSCCGNPRRLGKGAIRFSMQERRKSAIG